MFVAKSVMSQLGNPFYEALEGILKVSDFDGFVEDVCRDHATTRGRPSIPPGVYFRMLLVGYLEGIGSERGIAWRCADSVSLRKFLGYGLAKHPPDHASMSRTRAWLSVEVHQAVFVWILKRLLEGGVLRGKTLEAGPKNLEAKAAMRSIVRRDSDRDYGAWLAEVSWASGIETPTRAELAELDRKRLKNEVERGLQHPHDPQARSPR